MSLLPDPETFRRLVDGSLAGPGPAVARAGLALLAAPYGLAVAARNAAYDRGMMPLRRAPIPVVSIGNLTLGGTGKTPLVAWAARRLLAAGRSPMIASRGYGARRGETSDEAAELAILVPGVPHIADRDRAAAVGVGAAAGADVALLDDGFQHRRLARDTDIVAIDATAPFGGGRLFPRGLLREPIASLRRAHAIVLTRATAVDAARRDAIRHDCLAACRGRSAPVWAEASHRPVGLRDAAGHTYPLETIRGCRAVACAAVGNPRAFRHTLADLGVDVAGFRAFADHHAYGEHDLRSLGAWAAENGAQWLITTLKDLVKIRRERVGDLPIVAVEIALELSVGREALESLLLRPAA